MEIGLATYDRDTLHHFRLSRAAAEDVFRTLATEPRADRIHNPGLDPEREPTSSWPVAACWWPCCATSTWTSSSCPSRTSSTAWPRVFSEQSSRAPRPPIGPGMVMLLRGRRAGPVRVVRPRSTLAHLLQPGLGGLPGGDHPDRRGRDRRPGPGRGPGPQPRARPGGPPGPPLRLAAGPRRDRRPPRPLARGPLRGPHPLDHARAMPALRRRGRDRLRRLPALGLARPLRRGHAARSTRTPTRPGCPSAAGGPLDGPMRLVGAVLHLEPFLRNNPLGRGGGGAPPRGAPRRPPQPGRWPPARPSSGRRRPGPGSPT